MFPLISADELQARQRAGDGTLLVLDVRTPSEFDAGHVPGAVNIPHDQVPDRLAEIPSDKDLVLYCRSGGRATFAAGALQARGYRRLLQLEGDMTAWLEQQRPVESAATVPPRH